MLTKQEILNKAVEGLASQGFERCVDPDGWCCYAHGDKRCAWGWVDTSLTEEPGSVADLRVKGVGLAANLDEDALWFASELQRVHDTSQSPKTMRENLRLLAQVAGLEVPAGRTLMWNRTTILVPQWRARRRPLQCSSDKRP